MMLKIKPHPINEFPLIGVLIKGDDPMLWVQQIQWMGLRISDKNVFPIPGNIPNSVWGCLVTLSNAEEVTDIGRNEYCQLIHHRLFIPERAKLFPALTAVELDKLLLATLHLLHPEFGLVELSSPVKWIDLLAEPIENKVNIIQPEDRIFIPKRIKRYQIQSLEPEEVLRLLEDETFPTREALKEQPLNPFEKTKLLLYRQFFNKEQDKDGNGDLVGLPTGLAMYLAKTFGNQSNWLEGMQKEFEDLERRNKKKVEQLLDMLKSNPDEALKYAVPLDNNGTTRGGSWGEFNLDKRWFDFSLFGSSNNSGGSGGVANISDHFWELQKQYRETAKRLIKEGKYQKAAFVYMKLLKDFSSAAQTLEQGHHYQEAASVYLKHVKNKLKAAECYEKGRYYQEAIYLYVELKKYEKVGDLYLLLNDQEKANEYYQMVAEQFKKNRQFLKASLIYRDKMKDFDLAQETLLEGWRLNADAFNCLNNYLHHIKEEKQLWNTINHIYENEINNANRLLFLKILKYEYQKANQWQNGIRDMAYELLSELIKSKPHLVSELLVFNQKDKHLVKDTSRFIANAKRR